MKIWFLFLLAAIIIPIQSNQEVNAQDQAVFTPFQLQSCNRSSINLFYDESIPNSIIEIQAKNSTTDLHLSYTEYIKERTFNMRYVPLSDGDYVNISVKAESSNLYLHNVDDVNQLANYTAYGHYRIHQNTYNSSMEWKDYNLKLCTPTRMDVFRSEGNWVDNITLLVKIEKITNGSLEMSYSYSDFGIHESLSKVGNYSYTVNASNIGFTIEDYMREFDYITVLGSYSVVNNGHLFTVQANGFGFLILLTTMIVGIKIKRKD